VRWPRRFIRPIRIPLACCLVCATPAPSVSAQEPKPAEPLRTAITVTESVAAETPASLTILESEQLRRMPGVNLDDRLRLVPGFTLLRRNSSLAANPTTQGVSLRGIGSSGASRTLVLADGIPLNDPFGGWVYWTRTDPETVERTEVSRGATTSVFGDRAMGGAIHLVRPSPSREAIAFGLEGGNRGTVLPSASYSNLYGGRYGVSAGLRAFHTNGYFIVPGSIRGAIDTPANVRFVAPDLRFDFLGRDNRLSVRSDLLVEERNNGTQLQRNSTSLGAVSANYSRTLGRNGISLLGFHQRQQFHASFSAIAADRQTERLTSNQSVPSNATGGAGFANVRAAGWNLVGGADFLRVSGTSFDYLQPSGRREGGGVIFQRGMFAQADGTWKDFRLFVGSRYQWTGLENGKSFYSPSGGFAWGRRWLRARGSVYRAFRAPTLNELFREFRAGNTVTLANPNLRMETLFGSEIGADIAGERVRLSVTAFRNDLRGLIANATRSVSPQLIVRQRDNIAAAIARGGEASLRYSWGDWFLEAAYLFVDSRFSTGERIPQVPRNQGSLQAGWSRGATSLAGGLRAASLQFEDDRNTQALAGFAVFHFSAIQGLGRGLSAHFTLENAFDRVYLSGYTPQPQIAAPRLFRAGLRWRGRFR
jgi:outer membrane cobalamin receptor